MPARAVAAAAWVVLTTCALAVAEPTLEELQKENEALRQQNQAMQEKMDSVLNRLDEVEKALAEKVDKAAYQQQCRQALEELLQSQPPTDQWVSTMAANTRLKIYGFLRAEAIHDTRRTASGYVGVYVLKDPVTGKQDETSITARNSRLGFDLAFPAYNDLEVTGKLETDFGTSATTGTAELSPAIRIRQAYIQVKSPCATFLAGQAWDIFAPLVPGTDNAGVLWDAGNVGYRRPQFRMERNWDLAQGRKLLTQFALARAIGGDTFDNAVPPASDGLDDGSAAGWPDLQARLAYATRLLTERDTTLGVSGVWGRREVDLPALPDDRYSVCGVALDLMLPLTDQWTFRAEWYRGRGLGGYFGNIGQFYNTANRTPFEGTGGWAELDCQVNKDLLIRGGWGMDCVDDDVLTSSAQRNMNTISFVNCSYKITPNLTWTVEYEFMRTQYFEDSTDYDNHRVSTSFTLNF